MKTKSFKLLTFLSATTLAFTFITSLTGCASKDSTSQNSISTSVADSNSIAGTYTSTYTNGMGSEETAQIVLGEDASALLSFPGDEILGSDLYIGTYTYTTSDGVTLVSIKGLRQEDNSVSPYPALWSGWIDSTTGDCQITLNSDGTFERVLTETDKGTYVSGLYTYTEEEVTYKLELSLDGSCGLKEGESAWVEGSYSMDGTTVSVTLTAYTGAASFIRDGKFTATINSDNTFTPKATSITYTYAEDVYIEMIDQTVVETSILVLNDDGSCTLKKDGSLMLTDTYTGTYVLSEDVVNVSNLVDSNGEQIPGSEAMIGFSYITSGSFSATLYEDYTFVPITSSASYSDLAGTYTYTYTNPYNMSETMQIVLDDQGGVVLSMPGHSFITDSYTGTYSIINAVTITLSFTSMHDLLADNFTLTDGVYSANAVLSETTFAFASSSESGDSESWSGGTTYEDLSYVTNGTSSQTMQLYVPTTEDTSTKMPLFVTIHGGMFTMGDASMMSDVYTYFRDQGYVVASLNYTLGTNTYPEGVIDCKRAIEFLVSNADTYQIDTSNIIVMGESAGSTIASLVALSSASDFKDENQPTNYTFKATTYVDFYGPISNGNPDLSSDAIDSGVVNWLGDNKTAVDLNTYLSSTSCTNIWLQHGTADTSVRSEHATAFNNQLTSYNTANGTKFRVHYELLEGANHMDDAFYTTSNLSALATWLKSE